MRSLENKLGGGEGIEGLYGTLACGGMQKVLDCMAANCGLQSTSRLVDVGAGIGRPLLHAVVGQYAESAWGVEIDRVKADKGNAFMRYAAADMKRRNADWADFQIPSIRCAPIEEVKTLDPATHAYSFWEGVPEDSRRAFGRLFRASKTLQAVAIGQRAMRGRDPEVVMEGLGFGELHLVASFSVSMSGSGRSFTAYVFNRKGFVPPPLGSCAAAAEEASLQPATPHDAHEPALVRRSSSHDTEYAQLRLSEEQELAQAAKTGHRTRSRSGALPWRAYGGEPSSAPNQAPAARRSRGAIRAAAASMAPRSSGRPGLAGPPKNRAAGSRSDAVGLPPAAAAERPLSAPQAELPISPGDLHCGMQNSSRAQPGAEQTAGTGAPTEGHSDEAAKVTEAAATAETAQRENKCSPRDARTSPQQALRRSPSGGVQKASTVSPRKAPAAVAKQGNRLVSPKKATVAVAKQGNWSIPVGQAFRSRRVPVLALKTKNAATADEPGTYAPRGLGVAPQPAQ
ncbi:g10053 [Coccomyxa elongata]